MLSDIHLDPFHDPSRFAQLRSTPADGWAAILSAPASPQQTADFARLQAACNARGTDTPPELLASSLRAEKARQPEPLFVTVSGDLLAHQFDCRFHALAPGATAAELSAFAARTIAFVALQLQAAFPHSPIYFALGNNDSGCHDYREDPDSAFLQSAAGSFAPATLSSANRSAILQTYPQMGDANLTLPAPMQSSRLILLQDLFQSSHYAGCHGASAADTAAADRQIAWLRIQLNAARAAHQQVWIMAHIPPGIDVYRTFTSARNVCAGQDPAEFLRSADLARTIEAYPDVIRLALFGHTHMDEFRVFPGYSETHASSPSSAVVPGKLVPSISPVDGNHPAFTVAQVDPKTATVQDYTVYVAANLTGHQTVWTQEYTYSSAYHLPNLSGRSLAQLTNSFLVDPAGQSPASRSFQRYFYPGALTGSSAGISRPGKLSKAEKIRLLESIAWPLYACAMANPEAANFRACACRVKPAHAAAMPNP
ncbi:MAG: metallophosphoesterase [Acidobacteriaceae bacterium]